MKIAYNPITENPLSSAPYNDITFDLPGFAIYAKGVKFDGRTLTPFTNKQDGLVPAPNNGSDKRFLRQDGTWQEVTETIHANNADTVDDYHIKVVSGSAGFDPKTIYFVL